VPDRPTAGSAGSGALAEHHEQRETPRLPLPASPTFARCHGKSRSRVWHTKIVDHLARGQWPWRDPRAGVPRGMISGVLPCERQPPSITSGQACQASTSRPAGDPPPLAAREPEPLRLTIRRNTLRSRALPSRQMPNEARSRSPPRRQSSRTSCDLDERLQPPSPLNPPSERRCI
jgi:hypothetical protein